MKFSKRMNINNRWQEVAISDEEVDNAIEELMEKNYIQLKLCMQKVSELDLSDDQKIELAIALFNSSSIACYTMLGSKIEEKASEMKGGKPYKPVQPETIKKAEEVAEKKLSEKPEIEEEHEPSLIDEAFSQINDGKMRTGS